MTPPRREDDGPAPGGPLVGVLAKRGRFMVAEPIFERGRQMNVEADGRARPGDLVLLTPERRARAGRAKVAKVIGRPDVARDVIEALMIDRGLERRFPRAVEKEAEDAARGAFAPEIARKDLRDLPTITIDPATAKDFDDAISARELGDGRWLVHVHIADVAAHVRPGSALEREAHKRGTSVYVPGAVEPMLPYTLSSDACSLVPGVDRLALTVEMELHGAELARTAFHRTLIRSDQRLDYDEVDEIFAGRRRAEEPWASTLAAARAAAAALGDARRQAGALVIESSKPDFEFDGQGNVTGIKAVEQTESHRLIEMLMVRANEAVAETLSQRKIPTLYRVHERPEPEAVKRLADQLAALDVPTPAVPDTMTPQEAGDAVAEISQRLETWLQAHDGRGRRALTSLVLRSLKQARYSPENKGHAGLRSSSYCHFTSPIRRYPDLVCHRALASAIGAGEDQPRAGGLEQAGAWASDRERWAMTIERDADDVARCFLLERELGPNRGRGDAVFEGEVVGLAPVGAFVAFGEKGGYEGLLPVRRLKGDWWELDELSTRLVAAHSGRAIRLGDPVTVEVGRIDSPRGRVDLYPVDTGSLASRRTRAAYTSATRPAIFAGASVT
jgi:ribonuclease R